MRYRGIKHMIMLLATSGLAQSVIGQNVDEIKKLFPGEEVVIWKETFHVNISMKDGQPAAESKSVQELLYLSPRTASYMSQFAFYHSNLDKLGDYKAYTEPPEGKKIAVKDFKTTHNRSRSIFYDDVQETSFDFPSLIPGSIGHLEYNINYSNARLLPTHNFSRRVPVVHGELQISFPKDMVLKYIIRGNKTERVKFSSETRRGETTYTFNVENLDNDLYYPDAPSSSYYALHIIFYIESYINDNGKQVNYLSNTDDLYHFNWEFVKDINKDSGAELKHITDSLIAGVVLPREKAKRVYNWVQNNIKYVAFEEGMEGFIPRDASLVCNRRFGDCKDMSSILTIMLRQAGLQAYYTWIGTRDIPYDYTDVWLPITDNHMISAVKLDTGYTFLDGTDSQGEFGIIPEMIQGKQALVGIGENEYKIVRLPVLRKEENRYSDTTFLQLTDKGITGNIHISMTGYYATDMRYMINASNDKDREKIFRGYLNRGSNKFRLNHFEIADKKNGNDFTLTSEFDLQDYAKNIAGEHFLNLNLVRLYEHQEIDFPRRNIPIEFNFKNERNYVTILEIPEGYKVSFLPESRSFYNDVWGFEFKYEQKQNQVILKQHFENNHLLLPVDKF
ncbi:MAG TPA: transglutaminase-like domain-containing protein, partial [Chitinophagaceae bacterium]|nr:transglutaminase-like domain-containing protein [Chitinophagaceae bacterium]